MKSHNGTPSGLIPGGLTMINQEHGVDSHDRGRGRVARVHTTWFKWGWLSGGGDFREGERHLLARDVGAHVADVVLG